MLEHKNPTTNRLLDKKLPASRGPKRTLSTVEIARAAIQLANAESFQAITMQRVAQHVGVTTMALYRYFSGKADLVALMIDSVSESPPDFGSPTLKWSSRLKNWAHRCLDIYRSNTWFLEATSPRQSLMGPNELLWMEAALTMLAEAGLSPEDRTSAFLTLIAHVRGHATFRQYGKSEAQREVWSHEVARLLAPEARHYPNLLKAVNSSDFSKGSERAFDFGLECILRGMETRAKRP